jgi:hypothetical protein
MNRVFKAGNLVHWLVQVRDEISMEWHTDQAFNSLERALQRAEHLEAMTLSARVVCRSILSV